MDDKETKNIDGIKAPEDVAQETAEKIAVTVNKTNTEASSEDVAISSDGEIAVEGESTQAAAEPAPVAEVKEETKPAPAEEKPVEVAPVETKSEPEDPGIVPSVQPTVEHAASSPATEVARLKERNKHLKIWLVVLMLLLVAVASALVVYFAGQSKTNSDLQAQKKQNAELQAELTAQEQTATQKTIDDLTASLEAEKAKNAELQKTIDDQAAQITAYQTAVKSLLEKCGTACSSVDVPEESTDNTTN